MLRQRRQLLWPAIVEIAIHIGPAKCPFNRVDRPILVTVELLKMVVGQFRSVRVRNACAKLIPTRIVALGGFQYAEVHEIGSWLHNGFRRPLLMNLHSSRSLRTRRRELSLYGLALFLNSLRLALPGSGYRALVGLRDRRVLLLHGMLLGRLGNGDDRSRLFSFFSCRGYIAYGGPCEDRQAGIDEYPQTAAPLRHTPPT
jgi:hypothetical protein